VYAETSIYYCRRNEHGGGSRDGGLPCGGGGRLQGWKQPPLTHKYWLLERPPHRTFKGGREWRVDSTSFPISKTLTGLILDLEPEGVRELHWHPTADEWHYVIDGDVRVTLFGSHGRARAETLSRGMSAVYRRTMVIRSKTSAATHAASWSASTAVSTRQSTYPI
jgi:hypothetical protein